MDINEKRALEQNRWERYLYENHYREELASWARRLQYFRFVRAYGGHAGDGDRLNLRLRIENLTDLEQICRTISLPLTEIDSKRPIIQPGKQYTLTEYAALENPIPRFPIYRQPGNTHIQEIEVNAWVDNISLSLSVNHPGDPWTVSEIAVQSAEKIEALLTPITGAMIEPPQEDRHCICPEFYPEFWL